MPADVLRVVARSRWRRWQVDCAGMTCNVFAVGTMCLGYVVVTVWTIVPWLGWTTGGVAHLLLAHVLFGLMFWSWVKATFGDPGFVGLPPEGVCLYDDLPSNKVRLRFGEHVTFCDKCENYKPLRAHHCSTCRRCVRLMDHHCIWVNNCVGEYNHKAFMLFLLYTHACAVYTLAMVALRTYTCITGSLRACAAQASAVTIVLSALTLFLALLFALFVLIMGCDQLCSLWKDQTYIEKLKRERGFDVAAADIAPTSAVSEKHSGGSPVPPASPSLVARWADYLVPRWPRFKHVFARDEEFSLTWLLPLDTNHRHDRWYADVSEIDDYTRPPPPAPAETS